MIDQVEMTSGGMTVRFEPRRLRAACGRLGWSASELARRAGVTRPTAANAMHGRPVKAASAGRISRALRKTELLQLES